MHDILPVSSSAGRVTVSVVSGVRSERVHIARGEFPVKARHFRCESSRCMNTFNVTAEPGSLTSAPARSAAVSPIPGEGHTVLPDGPRCWAPPRLPTPGSDGSGTPVRAAFKRPDPNRPPAHRPPPSSRATLRLTVSRRRVVTKAATPCRWLRSPSFPWGLAVPRRSVRIAGAERGSGTGRRRLRRRRGLT